MYLILLTFLSRDLGHFELSVSLYYCIVYSAIQPLKAASALNKISSVQFSGVGTMGTVRYIAPPSSGLVPLYPQVKDAAYVKIVSKRL